jgi:CheY-like chemotaxis protein
MDAEIIKAIAELAWPIFAAIILLALLPAIRRIAQSRSVSIKYGQMELSVQDASEQTRKQIEDLQDQVRGLKEAAAPAAAPSAVSAARPQLAASARDRIRTILWVDDKPRGNAHEIGKLQSDRWEITTATSTDEALGLLGARANQPTVIISDMARREGLTHRHAAGLDLIREVRARQIKSPIYIYTVSPIDTYKSKVLELGGNGITSSPIELFRMLEHAV